MCPETPWHQDCHRGLDNRFCKRLCQCTQSDVSVHLLFSLHSWFSDCLFCFIISSNLKYNQFAIIHNMAKNTIKSLNCRCCNQTVFGTFSWEMTINHLSKLLFHLLKTKPGKMRHFITQDLLMSSLRRRRVKWSHMTRTPFQREATAPSGPSCPALARLVRSPAPGDDQDPKN